MTTNTQDSNPMKEQIDSLREFLEEKGVDTWRLCIVGVGGGESYLGEQQGRDDDGFTIRLWNPKRIIRIQQAVPTGLQVSTLITDVDPLEGDGTSIYVNPRTFSHITLQNLQSQLNILNLYKSYFDRKAMNDARSAGLHLPNSGNLVHPS